MELKPARRRILLSAFACSPLWGSEPGVGWRWLSQLARQYEIVLLTHPYFRDHLEPALHQAGLDVEMHFVHAPAFCLHPHRQLNSRLYYVWWQWRARTVARRLVGGRRFDLIHHLTWGTLRFPCFLGGLGIPLVMGPLGGGEAAPIRLFRGLPVAAVATEALRYVSLLWCRLDPLATLGPRRSALILCKTAESLQALPHSVHSRAVIAPEIGSPEVDVSRRTWGRDRDAPRRFRLLFAGRLIPVKGIPIALGAVRRMLQAGLDIQLDIAGDGPLRGYLTGLIEKYELVGRVHLLGAIPREELLDLYGLADLFLFPSLHDSSGNVVLEALSRGLPVVCLDLGGPRYYVDDNCGVVVKTQGLSRTELERAVADVIARLVSAPDRLAQMSEAAAESARRQSWAQTVRGGYALIEARLRWA